MTRSKEILRNAPPEAVLRQQENKLEALRREIAATTSRRDATRQELNLLIGLPTGATLAELLGDAAR